MSGAAPILFITSCLYSAFNGSRRMNMLVFASIAISIAAVLGVAADILVGQSPAASSQEATGAITGRVTIDNQGAPDVAVALQKATGIWPLPAPVARATTDKEGRFKMANLPAGRYYLVPLAPAYFAQSEDRMIASGKPVTLAKGENIEEIELALTPGGVITGRVTTAGGWPVIGQEIRLSSKDARFRQLLPPVNAGESAFKTDDRGIYRVYGLPTGRYIVSVRCTMREQQIWVYHPGVIEESQAKPIEVTAGRMTENIDIKLPPITQPYDVSGRVVDEATGQPIPKIPVDWGKVESGSKYIRSGLPANEQGEFLFTGLSPGRYVAFVPIGNHSEYYGDQVAFEVIDQDIAGLEIKARRASSVSGTVVIEGATASLPDLSQLRITVFKMAGGLGAMAQVGPDGRFRIPGLPPDKYRFFLSSNTQQRRVLLLGVERNGAWQTDGVDVAAGEQLTGLRLIVAYGTGVVNGQVQVVNGTLPEGARLSVFARRAGIPDQPGSAQATSVDARGRFLLEGLATGVHEIILSVYVTSPSADAASSQRWAQVIQTITVSSGGESQVTLVLDASNVKEK
jgi:5-hydroxyisourate hydrolase-like protein (transthyretin family)